MTEFHDRDLIDVVIDGQTIAVPAGSTIIDAAARLGITLPSLCGGDSLPPAGVCRLCVVDVGESALSPACCRTVGSLPDGCRIATHRTSDRVRKSVETLLELLLAEHPDWRPERPTAGEWLEGTEGSGQWAVGSGDATGRRELRFDPQSSILDPRRVTLNPVVALAERFGLSRSRFASRPVARQRDDTSPIISVDQSACILCERCVRTCGDMQHHEVISRAGRGDAARIAFDLDRPLGDSSCVACGECVPVCPTGALTFALDQRDDRVSTPDLERHPMFSGLATELLNRLAASITRRQFQPGDVVCREAERGETAFLIEAGDVQVGIETPLGHVRSRKGPQAKTRWGPFGLVWRFETTLERAGDEREQPAWIPIDAPEFLPIDRPMATLRAGDLFGEATAMLGLPRSVTARALSAVTVLELPREAMSVLRQNPTSRVRFDTAYLDRTLPQHLARVATFSHLVAGSDSMGDLARQLRPHVRLRRFAPGDVLVRRAERLDAMWLVRFGFVEETRLAGNESHVATYISPGGHFGDEAFSQFVEDGDGSTHVVEAPATWRAITVVDVACVDFTAVLAILPSPLGGERLGVRGGPSVAPPPHPGPLPQGEREKSIASMPASHSIDDLVRNHLARAEHLVTIDLARCIHCDDCVRACGEAHGGVTRLVRDGMRFDGRLLPTTCIACLNPVCLIGCPVGAIDRLASREIAIADWCIGCGSCAERCPYGNLVMHEVEANVKALKPAVGGDVTLSKPTTCDGCRDFAASQPPCVAACAHDAIAVAAGSKFVGKSD